METVALAATRVDPTGPTDAAPLIIAHGLLGSGRNWATLARRFAEDARRPRPVIVVDMRNHGASPWRDETAYPALGADLLDAIDRETKGAALLLGHSMGGKAAMAAALARPERVAGLIVADIAPVAYGDHGHDRLIGALRRIDLSAVSRRGDADAQLAAAVPEAPLRAFLLQNLVFENGSARWRANLAALEAGLGALMGWPASLAADAYAGPALFLHGGASPYVAEAGRAAVARQFPAAEIDALPGAGHWLHAEQPDAFFERVARWLADRP